MKKSLAALAVLAVPAVGALAPTAGAQILLTTSGYTQNFDGMGATGTTTPTGFFVGTGAGAVAATTVTVSDGSNVSSGNYNFGTTGNADRALGSLASSTGGQRDTQAYFGNNTGAAIASLAISYTGEQWRVGGANSTSNALVLQYSTNGTSFTPLGTSFNFNTPVASATNGSAVNGNDANYRVVGVGGVYTPAVPIAVGANFYLRWADADDPGTDHGIAIDDFSISVVPEPSTYAMMVGGLGLLLVARRARRRTLRV